MKIAICDDERACLDQIVQLVQQHLQALDLDAQVSAFEDADSFLNSNLESYDIVFLDMNLGDKNGIEVGKDFREANSSAFLVYITAFLEYAVNGYSVHAFNYLLKSDLLQTLTDCLDEIVKNQKLLQKRFYFKINAEKESVFLKDITYFESTEHKIAIHLINADHTPYSFYGKLSDVDAQLASDDFLRIHKSFLINMAYLESIKSRIATLNTGITLNCSKTNYQSILRRYTLWKGRQ